MLEHVATAYGHAGIKALRSVVSRVKRDDPLAPIVVLAPNDIAGTVARRYLAAQGLEGQPGPGVAALDVTTIARLAERLAAPLLAPRRPATEQILAAAWRRVLQTDPGVFAETAEHPATIRALVTAHRELRDLIPAEIDQVAAAGAVSAELVRLHRQVVDFLAPSWYDATDLLQTAAGLRLNAPVVLYLPQDLSNDETAFIEALAADGEGVVLAGHTQVASADEWLRARWPRTPKPATAPVATASTILDASDSDDEVRCVVRHVVRTLQDTPAHRVAVLYTASDPYAPLLHDHLAAAGIRVNGPGSRPVIDRALSRTVFGLLELADDNLARASLFRALSSVPLSDFTGDRIPVAAWERISRDAGVVRSPDWQVRLDNFVERHEAALALALDEDQDGRAAFLERRIDSARRLQRFALRLQAELDRAAGLRSWAELAAWCRELVHTLIGDEPVLAKLPPEERQAATSITLLLAGLEVVDEIDQQASLAGLRDALDAGLSEALPRLGRFGDGVLVAPLSQAIGLDVDVLHVVGLSEDLYPGRPGGDALLPDSLRHDIASLRSVRRRLGTAHRHLLAAFNAAPRVVVSFPRGDLRSASRRLPSRWLLDTFRELSGDSGLVLSQWDRRGNLNGSLVSSSSFSAELLKTPQPATGLEWRTRAASAGRLQDAVVDAATEMMEARADSGFTRFDGNLTGCDGLPDYRDGSRTIAPTALEGYVECPHQFFVSRLLRVEPLEQPEHIIEVSPMEIGNLVHRSFDLMVAEHLDRLPGFGEPWSETQRARLVQIAREQAEELEKSGLTGHPRLWQRERDRIEVDLTAMLLADDEWRAGTDARVAASEMSFGSGGTDPVILDVPNGQVRLRGSADKVDVGRDGTVYVTDIKTGSDRHVKGITPDDPLAGATRFQLPTYGLAARSRFGLAGSRVHADYWFVRRNKGRIGIDIDEQVVAALAETVGRLTQYVSQGLFPPRPPAEPDFLWVQCRYCNPDGIGHGTARERWERQRHDPALAGFLSLVEPDAAQENP